MMAMIMIEPIAPPVVRGPFSVPYALEIADQIRTVPRGFQVDRDEWPWCIEEACRQIEARDAKIAELEKAAQEASNKAKATETEDRKRR